mmetsp:Transcript_110250/g.225411  ORF Transcript_110250/g.225411 Transcript_110250/m.225411 type:complete len:515 (+) Transcript_110250:1-1545(+)
MGDLVDNPHPFGKLPCMTDRQGEIGVFESGAILQYLQDNFNGSNNNPLSPAQSAAVASWIVWANASLEPICLLSADDGSIKGTSLQEQELQNGRRSSGSSRSKNLKEIDRLDEILGNLSEDQQLSSSSRFSFSSAFLLGNEFTLADVAVASYLLFALRFFPETDLSIWPNVVAYMITCASREAYGEAFGRDVQASLLSTLQAMNSNNSDRNINRGRRSSSSLTLYGNPSSTSSVVNWACFELGLDLVMGDLARNPHPFGKIPCLTDNEGEITVFESGAILQYLLDNYQNDVSNMNMNEFRKPAGSSAKELAQISSWIVWANAQLGPICFIDETGTPQQSQRQRGPPSRLEFFNRPGIKFEPLDELNDLLGQKQRRLRQEYYSVFLVGDKFTLADVAIASYLLYIPQHFPETNMGRWPYLISYMKDCARRQGFSAAFGSNTQNIVLDDLNFSDRNGGRGNDKGGGRGGGRGGNPPPNRRSDRQYGNFNRPDNYEEDVRRNLGDMGSRQLFSPPAF